MIDIIFILCIFNVKTWIVGKTKILKKLLDWSDDNFNQ